MDDVAWKRVAKASDLVEGKPVVVEVGEEKVLLTQIHGAVYAVGHECPHYQEKLEKGALFGSEIVCKSHFARMDVTTGKVLSAPAMNDLPVYPVKMENEEVFIGPVVKPKFPKPAAAIGSDPRTFVIVGAGAAGNAAAETLRRKGFAGRIVMITEENERPYDRPNLSKDFMTGKAGEEWLPSADPNLIRRRASSCSPRKRSPPSTSRAKWWVLSRATHLPSTRFFWPLVGPRARWMFRGSGCGPPAENHDGCACSVAGRYPIGKASSSSDLVSSASRWQAACGIAVLPSPS